MDAQNKLLSITSIVFMTQIEDVEMNQITHGVSFLPYGDASLF